MAIFSQSCRAWVVILVALHKWLESPVELCSTGSCVASASVRRGYYNNGVVSDKSNDW